MDGFKTLHDFMMHTEAVTYILIVVSLLAIAGYWCFLSERDED